MNPKKDLKVYNAEKLREFFGKPIVLLLALTLSFSQVLTIIDLIDNKEFLQVLAKALSESYALLTIGLYIVFAISVVTPILFAISFFILYSTAKSSGASHSNNSGAFFNFAAIVAKIGVSVVVAIFSYYVFMLIYVGFISGDLVAIIGYNGSGILLQIFFLLFYCLATHVVYATAITKFGKTVKESLQNSDLKPDGAKTLGIAHLMFLGIQFLIYLIFAEMLSEIGMGTESLFENITFSQIVSWVNHALFAGLAFSYDKHIEDCNYSIYTSTARKHPEPHYYYNPNSQPHYTQPAGNPEYVPYKGTPGVRNTSFQTETVNTEPAQAATAATAPAKQEETIINIFCSKCGSPAKSNQRFCAKCGTELRLP